jgi:Tfp pilus assembly protein PilX
MERSIKRSGTKQQEDGIALLMAIFVLLVISVVAISMIVASGTETALAGNYRNAGNAYYAAVAGLEEGRGRMRSNDPNYYGTTNFPSVGNPMAANTVLYILNPFNGETVNPQSSSPSNYPDSQYATEFGSSLSSATYSTVTSSASQASGVAVPFYKWVRITRVTERSLAGDGTGLDINGDSAIDNTTPLYYDSNVSPGKLIVGNASPPCSTSPCTANPVFKIASFSEMPNGTEKLLEYTVAAKTLNLNFPSALTFGTSGITFNGANSNPYQVNGQDGSGSPPAVPGCATNPATQVDAIGATNPGDVTSIVAGIPSNRIGAYTGSGGTTPNVGVVTLPNGLATPAQANQTLQAITNAADLVINGNATQANMPSAMSASNPMTVVVNGDLSLTGNFTGYGLLVVTGNFAYSGTDGWKGVVLVIGNGTTTYNGSGGGSNEFDGAIFVGTLWDSSHNLLSAWGPTSYDISGGGGNGIYYNSCWIKNAQRPPTYQILSFREIPYND